MKHDRSSRAAFLLGLTLAVFPACDGGRNATLTDDDTTALVSMTLTPESLPASPTNAYADDEAAASLGRALFYDEAMSADGKVSCASCHDPDKGFSDSRRVSEGVSGARGARHSMPATDAALHPFLFWDGRADSVWSQPLKALEGDAEMRFTRVEVAHYLASEHAAEYEAVFGPLPDTSALPASAAPGMAEWDALTPGQQDGVNRAFANTGKALEAYERKLLCADTRFDQYVRGEVELTASESAGAAQFVQGGCIGCHSGPSFSDGKFHDLGLGDVTDTGRAEGLAKLLADPFNGAGAYSDDVAAGQKLLASVAKETRTQGAFRTASLRGVGQRARFGHLGEQTSLREFIDDTYDRGGRGRNGRNRGDLDPLLDDVDPGNIGDIVAFLHTLDCPELPPELLAP